MAGCLVGTSILRTRRGCPVTASDHIAHLWNWIIANPAVGVAVLAVVVSVAIHKLTVSI